MIEVSKHTPKIVSLNKIIMKLKCNSWGAYYR